jgi:hypothetical protein
VTLSKLQYAPGVVKTNSDYGSPGRYIDSNWVRFSPQYPEKMGGYVQFGTTLLTGVSRGAIAWASNDGTKRAAFGTEQKLYAYDPSNGLVDITPFRQRVTGTLTNPITTSSGSATVSVAHTAHGQAVGDTAQLVAASTVGGLTIAGIYVIATVPDANTYTFVHPSGAANANVAGGGGSTAYAYTRVTLGSNPLATTNGSNVVTVTDNSHLMAVGDTAVIAGASAFNNVTISGSYVVKTVPTANTYTITAGTNANASGSGGGTGVSVRSEISIGAADTTQTTGYGVGTFGTGAYGTGDRSASIPVNARVWAMDSYGQQLMAAYPGGPIYLWDPTVGGRAALLYGAPGSVLWFFITAERYITALGAGGTPLKMAWNDQSNANLWAAALTNTANQDRRVQGGSMFVGGVKVGNGINLLYSDTACFIHQWRADNYVFTTEPIGSKCGLIGPNAVCVVGDVAYWIGVDAFWMWNGTVGKLPGEDDIREWFFENLDLNQKVKIVLRSLVGLNELILLWQEAGQTEMNRYALYNIVTQAFSVGSVSRTIWIDRSVFDAPIATARDGTIYSHETGVDGNGTAIDAYIVAAPNDIGSGEANLDIFGFMPDFERMSGTISLYVLTRDTANQTAVSDGPYTLDSAGDYVDLRSEGKMAGFKIESNAIGGDFRLGVCRVDAQPAGARR